MTEGLAVVTGGTGGLGYECVLGLARAGLDVWMTGRDAGRGAAALASARAAVPGAEISFRVLDVADLGSVAGFAASVERPVAVLMNNAGVMALPRRMLTVDGFEAQIGTNFLGHFALTGHLLGVLRGGRVVNVASVAHRRGRIALDDLNSARGYDPWAAYAQSKLAMLMFGLELQRRSVAGGWGVAGYAAHPGWSATRIIANGPGQKRPGLRERIMQFGFNALGQSAADGALPLLHAALSPAAAGGTYWGPCCLGETRGRPSLSRISPQGLDAAARARLWDLATELTGVQYPAPKG